MFRTGNTSYVLGRNVIAVCSCGQMFEYAEDMNGHGLGNPAAHRWLYVKDVIIHITPKELRQWIAEKHAEKRKKRSKRG